MSCAKNQHKSTLHPIKFNQLSLLGAPSHVFIICVYSMYIINVYGEILHLNDFSRYQLKQRLFNLVTY